MRRFDGIIFREKNDKIRSDAADESRPLFCDRLSKQKTLNLIKQRHQNDQARFIPASEMERSFLSRYD